MVREGLRMVRAISCLISIIVAFAPIHARGQQSSPFLDLLGGIAREIQKQGEQPPSQQAPPEQPALQRQAPYPNQGQKLAPPDAERKPNQSAQQAPPEQPALQRQSPHPNQGQKPAPPDAERKPNQSAVNAQIDKFRSRLNAISEVPESKQDVADLVVEIDKFQKRNKYSNAIYALHQDAQDKKATIDRLAWIKETDDRFKQQELAEQRKAEAEERERQKIVTEIEKRNRETRHWTSASKPGDGSVLFWRDLAIGDSMATAAGVVHSMNDPIFTCGSSQDAEGITACVTKSGQAMFFKEEKLVGFRFVFEHKNAGKYFDLLAQRYGAPHQRETLSFQTSIGAKFEGLRATWNTPNGPMIFDERYRRFDQSAIGLTNFINESTPKPF